MNLLLKKNIVFIYILGVLFANRFLDIVIGDYLYRLSIMTIVTMLLYIVLLIYKGQQDILMTVFISLLLLYSVVQLQYYNFLDIFQWTIPLVVFMTTISVVRKLINTEQAYINAVRAILITSFILSIAILLSFVLFGIFQLHPSSGGITLFGIVKPFSYVESGGFFNSHTGLWTTANVMTIAVLSLVFADYIKKPLYLYIYIFVLLIAVILTVKKTALLGLILIGFYFLKNNKIVMLFALIPIITIIFLGTDAEDSRIMVSYSQIESSGMEGSTRFIRLNNGINSIIENPFFGSGPASVVWVHNGFVELWANLGIISIPFFLWLIKNGILTKDRRKRAVYVVYIFSVFSFESAINMQELMIFSGIIFAVVESKSRLIANSSRQFINKTHGY